MKSGFLLFFLPFALASCANRSLYLEERTFVDDSFVFVSPNSYSYKNQINTPDNFAITLTFSYGCLFVEDGWSFSVALKIHSESASSFELVREIPNACSEPYFAKRTTDPLIVGYFKYGYETHQLDLFQLSEKNIDYSLISSGAEITVTVLRDDATVFATYESVGEPGCLDPASSCVFGKFATLS